MPASTSSVRSPRAVILGCAALLVAATLAAYHNTFAVPLLFDDVPSVTDNPSILHLWPIWDVLNPTGGYGITVSGRPVLNLSLALCYAVSGMNVWSYHALNLLIHMGAALTLFGIVRRTLRLHSGQALSGEWGREQGARGKGQRARNNEQVLTGPGGTGQGAGHAGFLLRAPCSLRLVSNATLAGFVVVLLWALHPLQTEAVTYTIQRTESLMGLFFLLTFYGFIRAVESLRPRGWQIFTVAACLLGVGTKEVAATAPVLVLLYDRTFVAGTFREAWRRRRWLHLALAATWLPLLWLVAGTGWNRGGTAGFNVGVSPWAYWFTQFEAMARYLMRSFWPHPLVFEYGTFWAGPADAAPYALVVVPLAVATLVALWRRPVIGFLGAWFFAILAPTSLVPGTIQMIVEHRMYLPLAAVITLAVGAFAAQVRRRSFPIFLALAVAAGVLTEQRNRTYRSDLSLWGDTVAHSPVSAIAQSGFGTALYLRGRLQEALLHYEISLHLNPSIPRTHYNLGLALLQLNRRPEAAAQFAEAYRLGPRFYPAHFQLGQTRLLMGQPQEAAAQFEQVVRLMPTMAEAHYEWGVALAKLGRPADAIPHYREALRLNPDYVDAECDLGVALYHLNRAPEAVACFQRALRAKPNLADAHFNLGLALAQMGHADDALTQYTEAARLNPNRVEIQLNLGIALAQADRVAEALGHLQKAVQLEPAFAQAHRNLGVALAKLGRPANAIPHYREALRLNPDYVDAEYDLGVALYQLNRAPEAVECFRRALLLSPDRADAHFNLGLALARLGWMDQATAQYAETVRLDPKNVGAQLDLGIALAQAGKLPEALEHLGQAVKLDPGLPDAHCNLGIALAESGRTEEAVAEFQEALRLRPDYAAAHYNLGNALITLHRLPEARRHFEEALRVDPRFDAAREMLDRLQMADSAGAAR